MRTGIALGSNIGDRLQNLQQGRDGVLAMKGVGEPFRFSRIYETEPVHCEPHTMPYLNGVIEIDYIGEPILLLDELHALERKMGRPTIRSRNMPRSIDLDVLYVGNLILSNQEIMIPHPRIHSRRFVLAPLCDIQPELILPGYQESVSELYAKLPMTPWIRLFAETFDLPHDQVNA